MNPFLLRFFLLFSSVVFLSNGERRHEVPVDSSLLVHLQTAQRNNDLSLWVYTLLEWVGKQPGERAEKLHQLSEHVWRAANTPEEMQAWLDLLVNRGYAWLTAGDIVASTDAYNLAYQFARSHQELASEELVMEHILKPLGNNYTRLGDYEQAMFIHRKSLVLAGLLNNKEAMAGIYSNMANTSAGMGQAAAAIDFCRQGLGLAGNNNAVKGLLYSELADAFRQTNAPDSAIAAIQKSIQLLTPFGNDSYAGYWLLMAYQVAGDLMMEKEVIASSYYGKAYALQQKIAREKSGVRKRERAKLFQRMAELGAKYGRKDLVRKWSDSCLALLLPGKTFPSIEYKDLFGENTLVDLLFTQAVNSWNKQEAMRCYALCFAAEKKLRQEFVTAASKEKFIAASRKRFEQAIGDAFQAWEESKQPLFRESMLSFMENSKAQLLQEELNWQQVKGGTSLTEDSLVSRLQLLERALSFYEKELTETSPVNVAAGSIAAKMKQTEWELAGIKKKISRKQVEAAGNDPLFSPASIGSLLTDSMRIRCWFAGEQTLYVVETGKDGIALAEKINCFPGWKDSIAGFVHTYFEASASAVMNAPQHYYEQAFRWYQLVMGGHPFLANVQYTLLPDASLNKLPLEALVTKEHYSETVSQWPFLLQSASISYAYSMETLFRQMTGVWRGEGVSGFFLTRNGKNQPVLEAVLQEREEMERLIPDGKWYSDEAADVAAFRKAVQTAAVVHISSHGSLGSDSNYAPRIELFNAPFYLFESKEMNRLPSLVVLNACRTGNGQLMEGEGVQSMARAFTAGGSHAVVAAWWNVNDAAGAALISSFYQWMGKGETAPAALRKSKLAWLNNPAHDNIHRLPYFWAALNYHGNPAPPVLPGFNGARFHWWWLAVALALLLAGGWFLKKNIRGRAKNGGSTSIP